jgi:oligopeptide/dipeptide ABC transporter ATP-binding protein
MVVPGQSEAGPASLAADPLISASLPAHPQKQREEIVLTGEVPSPLNLPFGCTFHPRCPFVMDRCSLEISEFLEAGSDHRVSCHLYTSAQRASAAGAASGP